MAGFSTGSDVMALEHGLTVLTANAKHFGSIDGLHIEVFMAVP